MRRKLRRKGIHGTLSSTGPHSVEAGPFGKAGGASLAHGEILHRDVFWFWYTGLTRLAAQVRRRMRNCNYVTVSAKLWLSVHVA